MEKLKIAVNYNSINNLDVSVVPVRRRLPQVCFGSQIKPVQTQTDMITNVTIERFTNILNGENADEFSRIIDIILSGYENWFKHSVCEIYHGEEIQVLKIVFFCSLVLSKKLLLHKREVFPRSVATSNNVLVIFR